ncbi:hypothetical protein [Natrinema altunense]|uniref:Uncharacterized protein n=1 Tax=Natrinema altunense (strain JCM 12890 / CGMCC 1.3731 / AJ2) TaxID=1227494 RepID=L9ZEH7_NATA2|nr:hypothetical protein [Natrinema altunense]ELY83987.1 hypothetical protein C485_16090 [Natrinema altunense JCM 12890]
MSTSIDRWSNGIRARWTALERDWQSVVVGATIVGLVSVLGLPIPW